MAAACAAAGPPPPPDGAAAHATDTERVPASGRDAMLSLTADAVLLSAGASEPLGLPLGAFITPAASDERRASIITQRPPVTCSACGAAACHLCAVAAGGRGWTCALCGQAHALSPGDALRLGPVPSWPELEPGGGDFLEVGGAGAAGLPAPPAVAAALVVDGAAGAAVAGALRSELVAALAQAPPGLRVGLVLAGRGVGVVDAARAAAAAAAAAAGDARGPAPAPAVAVLPGSAGEPADHLVAPLVRTALAPVSAESARLLVAPLQSEPGGGGGGGPAARPRCLGPAIGVALSVLEAAVAQGQAGGLDGADEEEEEDEAGGAAEAQPTASSPPSRPATVRRAGPPTPVLGQVIVVTAGPPTRGPGSEADGDAAAYFDGLAGRAAGAGIVVDAFALGPGGASAHPLLARLAAGTGGQCVLHTGSATAAGGPATGLAPRLAAALAARVGFGGRVEVRASAPLVPVPVAPPAFAAGGAATAAAAAAHGVCVARCPLPHPRPGEASAVWLTIPSPPPPRLVREVAGAAEGGADPPVAAVQTVVRWVDAATGGVLTRVATAAVGLLPPGPAGAADAAIAAARPAEAVLLLAKQLAVDGLGHPASPRQKRKDDSGGERGAAAARRRLADFVRDAGRGAGAPVPRPRRRWLGGGGGATAVRLPPGLAPLAAAAYAAAFRCPAFAEGVPPAVRARALAWLAAAPPAAAGAALCPRLEVLVHGAFVPVPAIDVALALPRPGAAVAVLDAGDEVVVWLGRSVVGGPPPDAALALKAGRDRAAALAAGRSPPPEVCTVVEGSTPAVHVLARLLPAHLDPPGLWVGTLPAGLGAAAGWPAAAAWAAAAMRGLLCEDEPGYAAWCESVGIAVVEDGGV